MKKLHKILLFALLAVSQLGMAQPMYQFSQYMFSDYALNPAIVGTHDYWQIKSNFRQQWAGIPDGPTTYMLGAYGPHKTMPMGYGGYIFNDVVGPIKYLGMYGSYAYSIRISGDIRLSMGLSLGVIQNSVEYDVLGEDDPLLMELGAKGSKIMPDGSLGFYLYTSQYFFGASFNHLMFNNVSMLKNYIDTEGETIELEQEKIKPYFNIQGGYKYNLNRNFDIYPSVLMKTAIGYDFITDINVRTIYQKMVWAGAGFRYTFKNPESIVIFLGYNYSDLVNVGYSYDISISKFGMQTMGSHEVMIGVKFDDIRKSRSKRKIR
ncbi:MAG: PorP/SprF family type IX secretion system membrane protein [Salinivirgaceae bacterium]|jgi:type IX secretion system PorP/SprF family membrane protein|nr:PorP/SprF family type IX secretion system membrane protein [Salinivirgaceae bacterium]